MSEKQHTSYSVLLLSFFCSLFFTLCFLFFQQGTTKDSWVDFLIATEHPAIVQLFYDTGNGFRQLGGRQLPGQRKTSTLRFQLPEKPVKRLRLQFTPRAGEVVLGQCFIHSLYKKRKHILYVHKTEQYDNIKNIVYLPDGIAFSGGDSTPQIIFDIPENLFLRHYNKASSITLYFLIYPFVFLFFITIYKTLYKKKRRWSIPEYGMLAISLLLWLGLCFCAMKKTDKTIVLKPITGNGSIQYNKEIQREKVNLQRSDGLSIYGFYYPAKFYRDTHPTVLILHGNYPNGQQFPLYPVLATELANCGFPVLTIDFTGYGESDDPLTKGEGVDLTMENEVETALQWLKKRAETNDITIIGHSMGADPALRVGLEQPAVSSVVLIGPPRRVQERFHTPSDIAFFWGWAKLVRKSQYGKKTFPPWFNSTIWKQEILRRDMLHLLPRLSSTQHKPILFIDGEKEDVRDIIFLQKYVNSCSFPVAYLTLQQGNHNCNVHKHKGETFYNPHVMDPLISELEKWIEQDKKQRLSETLYNLLAPLYRPTITLELNG